MVEQQQGQEQSTGLDANKYVIGIFLFVLSYGALFALGSARNALRPVFANIPVLNVFFPFPEFSSLMYLLMPVAGFFFIFLLVDWLNQYFEKKPGFSPLLPVVFFVVALAAFYIALFWYIGNYAQLAGRALTIEEANALFASRLKNSAYYLFVLSGLLGWVSRVALEKIKL